MQSPASYAAHSPYPLGSMVLRATRGGALASGTRQLANLHPYASTIQKAYRAYQTGKAVYPVAKSAYSAARSKYTSSRAGRKSNAAKKREAMRRVGDDNGTSEAKNAGVRVGLTNMNPQQLYQDTLLDITKNATTSETLNRRLRDVINFRGVKICMNFRAEGAIGTTVAWMNVAVISPKSDLTASTAIPNAEFFRHPMGDRRDIDFGDASLNNLDYACCSINTDRYNVHKRHKVTVGPAGSTEGLKERYVEFYIPIDRQIRYQDSSAYPEGKNMYLVWWFSTADGGVPVASVKYQYSIKKYFREPGTC